MSRSFGSNAPPAPRQPQQPQWRPHDAHDPAAAPQQASPQAPHTAGQHQGQQAAGPGFNQQGFSQQGWPGQVPAGFDPHRQGQAQQPAAAHYPPQVRQPSAPAQQGAHPQTSSQAGLDDPRLQAQAYQLGAEPYRAEQSAMRPSHGADNGGYDLGSYSVPQGGHDPRFAGQPQGGVNWPPEPGFEPAHGNAHGHPHGAQQAAGYGHGSGHLGQGHDRGYPPQPGMADGMGEHDTEVEDEFEYEDEPGRGRRWLIVAALVGSIGVGGAMAYGYKSIVGPSSSGIKTAQVVKASRDPVRIAPQQPGGKRFGSAEDKFMNRLPPAGGGQVDSAATVDSNGVRRVPTVRVGRDLAVAPPPVALAPAESVGTGVPGMTIIGSGGPGAGSGSPPSFQPPPQVVQTSRSAPSFEPSRAPPPRAPTARVAAVEPPARTAGRAPPPRARVPAEPQRRAALTPTGGPKAAAAAVRPRGKTKGFVAVLGYQNGRMEALKMMADLQQKYPILQGQKLDVLESDQSARGLGVIYRVVAGPPTARSKVSGICGQLKTSGYKGCWPMAR